MLKLFDRLVIASYIRTYIFCLVSLLSLYIVVDLFTNLDNFADKSSLLATLKNIGAYYLYHSAQIFDRLCEPIVLMAAMFTVGWMQRNNELLPLLSAGVPTRRVLRPVLIGASLMLSLGIANQELVVPEIADALVLQRDDPEGASDMLVQGAYDTNGVHVEGWKANRKGLVVYGLNCTIPETLSSAGLVHLSAKEGRYVPPGEGKPSGGWMLMDTYPAKVQGWDNPNVLEMLDDGRWFLHTQNIDFETVTRHHQWYMFASTERLNEMLHRAETRRLAPMAVLLHQRLTRPLLGMLLVVMGLSIILKDPNRHVFISSGLCLILCTVFFGVHFACKHLGDSDLLAPALAAWLPVLIFGPLAFAMFDAIHT